jgi:hypothetical protein
MKFPILLGFFVILLVISFLAGCGGSSSSTAPQTVSGVAAAGAPLIGTIYLKDSESPSKELSTQVASDGSFSFNISGLAAPFLLKAIGTVGGKDYTIYSFAAGTGIANINPLSHLAVAEANGSDDLATLYANPSPTTMQAINNSLAAALFKIQSVLNGTLSPLGVGTTNFISDPFTANHQGPDLFFDLYSLSVQNGTVSIIDKARSNTTVADLRVFLMVTISIAPYTSLLSSGNVCVMPFGASVKTSGTMAFSAVVIGMVDQQVTWSVVEPNGGTITTEGIYTAPPIPGTYHVQGISPNSHTAMQVPVIVSSLPPVISVLAGSSTQASPVDGTGSAAVFWGGGNIAVDGGGNVFVSDYGLLRKVSPSGVVSTINLTDSVTGAVIAYPSIGAIVLDNAGNIYATSGYSLVKITPSGVVSKLAGSGTSGSNDGIGAAASFGQIQGIAVDGSGNVYVRDSDARKIRKVTPGGVVSTFAGSGLTGSTDGTGTAASFNLGGAINSGIAVDKTGNVYVLETPNNDVRKITPNGVVSTFAGGRGRYGFTDGGVGVASFSGPNAITVDGNGYVYVMDGVGYIRMIDPYGTVSTKYNGWLGAPISSIAADSSGNIYVMTWGLSAEVVKFSFP